MQHHLDLNLPNSSEYYTFPPDKMPAETTNHPIIAERWDQNELRARFCQALSDMYKNEVPLYGTLVDLVREADAIALQATQKVQETSAIDPDKVLPSRHRVERHGAIRLGTAHELSTIRRMFAVMGMYPVGYYDLSQAGFPMHATAFRPRSQAALAQHPFRVFTTVLRMELLTEKTRELAQRALQQRNIFTPRLIEMLDQIDEAGTMSAEECSEFINEALETFRWHSKATVTLDEYMQLKFEHPLIADIVSFPSAHINHLTPRTIDIDLVQQLMVDYGMPAKERIEGPPKRKCPILLRQTSFKALEETVLFRDGANDFVKGSHTARFGEVEQRGYALTREGRRLYDQILDQVNAQSVKRNLTGSDYDKLLHDSFTKFPDSLSELHGLKLAYFEYRLTPTGEKLAQDGTAASHFDETAVSTQQLLDSHVLSYEPLTYEDFLPLSAGGIFNSNLGDVPKSKQLIMTAEPDFDGFQRCLGTRVADEFHLYAEVQETSLRDCARRLKVEIIGAG